MSDFSPEIEHAKNQVLERLSLIDEIRARGHEMKREGPHWVMLCPFHAENSPSFKVKDGENHFHCYGCGAHGDVLSWLAQFAGRDGKKLCGKDFIAILKTGCKQAGVEFPDSKAEAKKPKTVYPTIEKLRASVEWQAGERKEKVAAVYEYCNPATLAIELIVFRLESEKNKRFLQAMPVQDGFIFSAPEVRPIYNRARILEAQNIVIVEGEKKVHALHALGIVATCSPGGANSAAKADWTPLAGKAVTIWRDNNAPGQKYLDDSSTELKKLNPLPEIFILDIAPLGLSDGEDCVDYIARLTGTLEEKSVQVHAVINSAQALGGFGELERQVEDAIAGRRYNVPWCWSALTKVTRALTPGSVVILCGGGGSTKSLGLVQNLRFWMHQTIPACGLMLEDGLAFHMARSWAQMAENKYVTEDEWLLANPEQARKLLELAKAELKLMEGYIEAITDPEKMTPQELLFWIEAKAIAGKRVIAIDPLTAMMKGQFGFLDDFKFLISAKKIVEKYRASLILVTHPRKMASNAKDTPFTMSDIAGGVCYQNLSHCIIQMRKCDNEEHGEKFSTRSMGMIHESEANRFMVVLKSRNARGNCRVGLWFNEQTFSLEERGIVLEE